MRAARQALRRCGAPAASASERLAQASGDAVVPVIFDIFTDPAHRADPAASRAAAQALTEFDTTDARTEAIAEGAGGQGGYRVVTSALEAHLGDAETCSHLLRAVANMCFLTLEDESDASNQALLGAEGAVPLVAQALHRHGAADLGVCARGLQALLLLTMFNKGNLEEALTNDAVNLTVAMLSTYEADAAVQQTGLALLLRLLHAPVKDSPQLDYVHEENPLTALARFVAAAEHHVDEPAVHEHFWHGLKTLAHNHKTLPAIVRALRQGRLMADAAGVLESVALRRVDVPFREQMLANFSAVATTLLEGETGGEDTGVLSRGDVAKVCVAGLNHGVNEEVEYALLSVLMALSSQNDPIVLSETGVQTLLMQLLGAQAEASTKMALRAVWNVMNYQEGKRIFSLLNGLRTLRDVRKVDEETTKLVEDIEAKAQHALQA